MKSSFYFFFIFGLSSLIENNDRMLYRKAIGISLLPEYFDLNSAISFKSIKIYLTFSKDDPIDYIVLWLFEGIYGRAKYIIIGKTKVDIDYIQMLDALKKQTVLLLN